MVGMSGTAALRLAAVTASARIVPALICGAAGGIDENAIGVWPPTTDWIIGPPPPNGTDVVSSLVSSLNNSPDRCGGVPVPGLAMVYLPGDALMRSTSSFTVFTGTDGCTTSEFGVVATSEIGMKSFTGS